jgi:hypothetical protein
MREIGLRPPGPHPDPAHWQRTRAAALERDRGCVLCGSTERLELHHRTYERWGHEELGDVYVLCRGHHDLVTGHEMRRRSERRRFTAQPRRVLEVERIVSVPPPLALRSRPEPDIERPPAANQVELTPAIVRAPKPRRAR